MSSIHNTTEKRIIEIDFIKGIAIVMVVIGHTNSPSWLAHIISLVHMPLFFMASGFLSFGKLKKAESTNVVSFLLRKIKTLYLPFVSCSISVYTLYYSLGWIGSDIELLIRQIFKFILFGLGLSVPFSIQHLWFLKTLFAVSVLYYLLRSKMINIKWLLYTMFASLPFLFIILPPPFFVNIQWPIRAFFYFLLGYSIRQLNLNISTRYLIPLAILWVILGIFLKEYHIDMRFSTGFLSCSMIVGSITAFLFLIGIAKLIYKTSFFDFFCFCGRKSLYIYLLHLPIFFIFSKLFFDIQIGSCVVNDIHWGVYVLLIMIPVVVYYSFTRRTVD